MHMQELKFLYDYQVPYIFVLSVVKDVDFEFGKSILIQIINYFGSIYEKLDSKLQLNKDLLTMELKSGPFNSEIDQVINKALLQDYFKHPTKMVDEIESCLTGIFGSIGKTIVQTSIQKVCKTKEQFKKEDLYNLISQIEFSLIRRFNSDQVKRITEQITNLFSIKIL